MQNSDKKGILIIDDDIDYLIQMKIQLEGFGFNVKTISTMKEAEEYLKVTKPDLVIVDLMMENMDSGFVLCYQLKKKYTDVPVIIVTAVTSEAGIEFGINTAEERQWIKADSYLEKGIRYEQLHREINKLLKM